MNRGKLKNRVCRVISFGLVLVTVCSMTVGAESIPEDESWREKIDAELWEEMEGKSEEDLIPVYLWLKSIEEDTVTEAMIEEKQMDPAVYENEEAFQKQIVPALEAPIVARVGYEKAHAVVLPEEVAAEASEINSSEKAVAQSSEKADSLSEEDPDAFLDQSISLVDRAIQGKNI